MLVIRVVYLIQSTFADGCLVVDDGSVQFCADVGRLCSAADALGEVRNQVVGEWLADRVRIVQSDGDLWIHMDGDVAAWADASRVPVGGLHLKLEGGGLRLLHLDGLLVGEERAVVLVPLDAVATDVAAATS